MKKPEWFKIKFIENEDSKMVKELMKRYKLHSVCQSAHCPNCSECWSQGTASFMIMGEYCTRGCKFCAVKTMLKPLPPDPEEPKNLAEAVSQLNLKYVVITSVTRDDLEDGGAEHFAKCVERLKGKNPNLTIEALIPDFSGRENPIKTLVDAKPDVVSHNLETIERLTNRVRDARAYYEQSLGVLEMVRRLSGGKIITKTGIMVGLGETNEEVKQTMLDALEVGVDIFTIGQYLQPTQVHVPIERFVTPEEFEEYEKMGYEMGFKYVASGPLVRSSYKAGEPFINKILRSNFH